MAWSTLLSISTGAPAACGGLGYNRPGRGSSPARRVESKLRRIFVLGVGQVRVHPITAILQHADLAPESTARELVPLLYSELRAIARHLLSAKPPGQTLQTTALVNEAYLRLADSPNASFSSRQQFFAAAARAM